MAGNNKNVSSHGSGEECVDRAVTPLGRGLPASSKAGGPAILGLACSYMPQSLPPSSQNLLSSVCRFLSITSTLSLDLGHPNPV